MNPTICFWLKSELSEDEIHEMQAKWGLPKIQIRKDEGTDRKVVTYACDPLDPTVGIPRIPPAAIEKVTARLPVYEDGVKPGTYTDKDLRVVLEVRAAARGENGALVRFQMFSFSAPDIGPLTLVYRKVLKGDLQPEEEYGIQHSEEVQR